MKLSIIIPVYNEEKTVAVVLEKIAKIKLLGVQKEIIIVDDGSTDATASVITNYQLPITNLKMIRHKKNSGKGAAVRTGIQHATGDYILIQDADLEYNPDDIPKLLKPILEKKAVVVYGTRLQRLPNFGRDERRLQFFVHYVGNRLLSLLTSILYGQWITDMETCYKIFPRNALSGVSLRAISFELEPEITAKLCKKGYKITELPISTNPRGYEEGKKLHTIRDGYKAVFCIIKYRFVN